jgi:acetolactate synthase I/II/III large subunit
MRVADYIMAYLAAQGIDKVFTLPGGGVMHLIDAIAINSKLKAICGQHEQACGIAAEAWGRVTGRPGVVLVTTGPGATNVITPVVGAWIDSVPLLVISGQVKRSDQKGGTGVRQMGVQEVDIIPMVESITKYAVTLNDPADVRAVLGRALRLATSGRRGPVWIEVPLDVQGAPLPPDVRAESQVETSGSATIEDLNQAAAKAIELISAAERPVILAGQSIRLSGSADVFNDLVAALEIPVLTTPNSIDLLPYADPLNMGLPGSVALRSANFTVQNSDLLLVLGARIDNTITAFSPRNFARGARKIVVDIDPYELKKHQMKIDLPVLADVGDFMRQMLNQAAGARKKDRRTWLARCANWKTRYPVQDGKPFADSGEISHHRLVYELGRAIPEDCIIVTGSSGLAVETFYLGFRTKRKQRIFNTTGLGAMGFGLPALIGAAIAAPDRKVVGFEGDGSLQLNVQELYTVKALNLPVVLFVVNNAGYASIRTTQRNYFKGRFVGTGPEAGLFLPDICRLAEAIGIESMRIEGVENLARGLAQALNHRGPLIVDIVTQKDEVLWPKVAATPQPDGSMVSMPLEDMTPLLEYAELEENMLVPLLPASRVARGL